VCRWTRSSVLIFHPRKERGVLVIFRNRRSYTFSDPLLEITGLDHETHASRTNSTPFLLPRSLIPSRVPVRSEFSGLNKQLQSRMNTGVNEDFTEQNGTSVRHGHWTETTEHLL
jgi:hypothetical protein